MIDCTSAWKTSSACILDGRSRADVGSHGHEVINESCEAAISRRTRAQHVLKAVPLLMPPVFLGAVKPKKVPARNCHLLDFSRQVQKMSTASNKYYLSQCKMNWWEMKAFCCIFGFER